MDMRSKKSPRNIFFLLIAFACSAICILHGCISAFAPDKVTITKKEILSSRGFINPITIERLKVDSIGEEKRPVKYTIEYLTTCSIKQQEGKPPVALKEIRLYEPGRYIWSEQNANIPILHIDLKRSRLDSLQGIIWSTGSEEFDICPMKFEPGNWYFVTFLDPQIVGAYIFIDEKGNLKQYTSYSGVSPI
jgi:hypothetical protein